MGRIKRPKLQSAVERHLDAPETFRIPDQETRKGLKPEWMVKLIFVVEPEVGNIDGERMWVEVVKVHKHHYVGRLSNTPVFVSDLEFGDLIRFEPDHVCSVDRPSDHRLN